MTWKILQGDCLGVLRTLPPDSVYTVVTSPPYWGLRDYGVPGQLGLEATPGEYVARMVEVFREVRRVLRPDGQLWLNLGDSYASTGGHADSACRDRRGAYNIGNRPEHDRRDFRARPEGALKPKDLVGIPWRVAFALQADGWWLRADIIWHKPNPMPESVLDRPTKAHEYLFLLTKSEDYFYDALAIAEPALYGDHHRNGTPDGAVQAPGQTLQAGISKRRTEGDKPRGHSRRHDGFGDRWDGMTRQEQCSGLRNRRSVWTVATHPYPEAHFATFPIALVKPCILAGTSEVGACAVCGAPWQRVVERVGMVIARSERGAMLGDYGQTASSGTMQEPPRSETVGWARRCDCPHSPPRPATVLDPFSGAGTTGVVAARLGRDYLGIELNPAYVEMSRRRIDGDAPMFNRFAEGE